ncbi:hypothetical protein [Thauera aromatica]|uniref:hypothetical protein n=1 Tax=Thauera aromatica TaxID=59405 RepID=UPI001FFCA401|nr:hypothetical protein [Thauera aromatica]MCK2097567.1 hypothetical protein [Thauera aromatica]
MTSPSDDILDRIGFLRSDILPLLAEAGVHVGDAGIVQQQHEDCPDWKLRLAVADYLTDQEVAAAIAGIDLSAPGWLSDQEQAELSAWADIVQRACASGSLKAEGADWNGDGTPRAWGVRLPDLAAWCASKSPPIPYPLPGDPGMGRPATDAGLREALAASEKERAEWKAKAEALIAGQQSCAILQAEIDRLRGELKARADEVAALTAERGALRADALAGKARTTALKIIGGLAMTGHGMTIHADRLEGISEMVRDLQRAGAEITDKTLREWIKGAAAVIDPPSKDASSAAKPA